MTKKPKLETHENTVCDCGRHCGLGIWIPEKRAEVYAWYRDKFRRKFTYEARIWLADYQHHHGYQKPNV